MTNNNSIYTHIAGRFTLPQFQMFGFVLILWGGYLLYTSNFLGFIALAVGLGLFFMVVGIQIDFDKKLHREFFGLFGIKFGKWRVMHAIDYVTVFIEHYAQRGSVASIDNTRQFRKVKISLIVTKTEKYDAGYFNDKWKAMEAGKMIARKLNIKLLDYTGKEPKWINLDNDDF